MISEVKLDEFNQVNEMETIDSKFTYNHHWKNYLLEPLWSSKNTKEENVWKSINRFIKVLPYFAIIILIICQIHTRKNVQEISSEYRSICRHENITEKFEMLRNDFKELKSENKVETAALMQIASIEVNVSSLHNIQNELKLSVNNTLNQAIPIGFTYTQLPFQSEPSVLWNWAVWQQITANYSGHFFRAEGGNSLPFGKSQSDAMQTHSISSMYTSSGRLASANDREIEYSMDIATEAFKKTIRMSNETRPINYAIRIWQRTA